MCTSSETIGETRPSDRPRRSGGRAIHGKKAALNRDNGILPRLLLFWTTTTAVRKGSRGPELGPEPASFMTAI